MAALQNKIVPNRDNPVVITFTSGVDLSLFTKVEAKFGADIRDSVADPDSVVVVNTPIVSAGVTIPINSLLLKFGDTAETTTQFWEIVGYDAVNTNGVLLTDECFGNLASTSICT